MKNNTIKTHALHSEEEALQRNNIVNLFKNSPLPDNELLDNLNLYTKRQDLSRVLFINELYQKILDVHGVICEFGVRWGQNLALMTSLRGIYEPFNYNRKLLGFDTFSGFPSVHEFDELNHPTFPGETIAVKKYWD